MATRHSVNMKIMIYIKIFMIYIITRRVAINIRPKGSVKDREVALERCRLELTGATVQRSF
jgi:hypothetical protein